MVLKQVFKDRNFLPSQIVSALTSPQPKFIGDFDEKSFRFLKELANDVDESAIRFFLTSNHARVEIESIYGVLTDVVVMKEDEIRAAMEPMDRDWTAFYKKFPDSKGIVYLSAPGFSDDGDQCVLEIGQQQGGCWGHGVAYLYRRTEEGWIQGGKIRTWVS